jgi:hypothetical protein
LIWNSAFKSIEKKLKTGFLMWLAPSLCSPMLFSSKGTYSYLQMIAVLDLIVFSISIGSQLMAFSMYGIQCNDH